VFAVPFENVEILCDKPDAHTSGLPIRVNMGFEAAAGY